MDHFAAAKRNFFGPDSGLYDDVGQRLVEIWHGLPVPDDYITARANTTEGAGWGMYYLVGFIYFIFGPSILVAQSFCGFTGIGSTLGWLLLAGLRLQRSAR